MTIKKDRKGELRMYRQKEKWLKGDFDKFSKFLNVIMFVMFMDIEQIMKSR